MLLLYMLLIQSVHDISYNLYDDDCLLYYVYEPLYVTAYEIIPYCFRSSEKRFVKINNTFDTRFRFQELREKNVSSEMLLSWSSTIDLAEKYQSFLNYFTYSLDLEENELFFYNCSSPWFGSICQFSFDLLVNASFNEIVDFKFNLNNDNVNHRSVTCYEHINCSRSLICLDWREICDGKIDCFDESDEFNCWEIEMNECSFDEYRCYNGQCIPGEFFGDNPFDPDCIDGTDEVRTDISKQCIRNPAFHCEEMSCREGEKPFPCGDGQCSNGISSCRNDRDNIFLDDFCSRSMGCIINPFLEFNTDREWCKIFCQNKSCIANHCSSLYQFPSRPIAFGHVRFLYINKKMEGNNSKSSFPDLICYDEKRCEHINPSGISINGSTCHYLYDLGLNLTYFFPDFDNLVKEVKTFFDKCLVGVNERHFCNDSIMYKCFNSSKCISKHRLLDGIEDCPLNDDETINEICPINNCIYRFNCTRNNITKYFSSIIVQDGKDDCQNRKDEIKEYSYEDNHIYFQKICDGIEDLRPQFIEGQNQTDETDCDNWPCNNTYTRCNGLWTCKDGADDINCPQSTCPKFQHNCIFFNDTSKVSCLPINRAGDGIIDCLGATDEPFLCRLKTPGLATELFRCQNDTQCLLPEYHLCNSENNCLFHDDEIFCSKTRYYFCTMFDSTPRTDVEQFICNYSRTAQRSNHFRLGNIPTYPKQLKNNIISRPPLVEEKNELIQSNQIEHGLSVGKQRCNRGIPVEIRTNGSTNKSSCLCPPSYYGDECQYQNERVSVTIQIRVMLEWRTTFTFVITLIDDEKHIESYEQIEYLSIRDCNTKYHLYLLYSTRPKNSKKTYSIQIDLFNKVTLTYRASWIYPVRFPFLPVYRQSIYLKVPITEDETIDKCSPPCIHGKCLKYVNDQNSRFCQCSFGWSGVQCINEDKCYCANNSQCIGNSICLCPIGQYGPRCYLKQSLCHSNSCINDGQCVTKYEHQVSSNLKSSMCICSEEYTGDRCEDQRTRIEILFDKRINIPQSLLIHLIRVENKVEPIRTSVMKKIGYDQNDLTIYTSVSFNLAFVEIIKKYYLIILRDENIVSMNISTMIKPTYRCKSINELFNINFTNQHFLKRVKWYHIPCEKEIELSCFYDSIYFCLCDLDRHANCFEFNSNISYDCGEKNFCANGGECFEDDIKCPRSYICICPDCYYGSRCQFSTQGSTLSLDVILGYQIRPNIGISEQYIALKVGIIFSVIALVFGLISSFLSFITFQMKKTRDVGCGLYLLTSSITSMFIMIVLSMKFWFLLGSQIGSINNRLFLQIECIIVDYILRFLVTVNDWLCACVAIERTINVSKGINFNKTKSKLLAKWNILIVCILTLISYIHDPIHRNLIDDKEEGRIWCVTKYSLGLQQFDWSINIFHFSFPFLINLMSSIIIIIRAASSRFTVAKQESFTIHLRDQFRYHKHLLISPFVFFLLSLPRLIISFLSGCMISARNPWLYLIGYYISFTPPMLTFLVFVLPSKIYKQQFIKSIHRFWNY